MMRVGGCRWALVALLGPWLIASPALAKPEDPPKPAAAKPAAAKKKPKAKDTPKPREPGSKPGEPDQGVRQQVTGNYPEHSTASASESKELKAMRELDRELFPPDKGDAAPWSSSLESGSGPEVSASGLPQAAPSSADGEKEKEKKKPDLSWLSSLTKPDFPVKYDASVVRYLTYYKDDPRGQSMVKAWIKKSGRYKDAVVKLLRQYQLPEDLVWLVMVESGFDATIHSHAGAAGLWQFMPATGKIYGLTVNRRVDERLDPERSTHAALKHLKDLYQRFGTWELAFAAYNMGYGGLLASIRKYNTNDYWALRKLEAGLPYETALYVPKIMAMAIVAKNTSTFGCDSVVVDGPEAFGDVAVDPVAVAPGVTLDDVAKAIGEKKENIAALNPHVIGSRLPPLQQATLARSSWTVYVPKGSGQKAGEALPASAPVAKYGTHEVRWGETLASVATAFSTTTKQLEALNDLYPSESPRPGTTIFVPAGRVAKSSGAVAKALSIVAVVPDQQFSFVDRRRVIYEAVYGDTVEDVARVCGVTATEVRRWNHLEARARLQDGMHLQLFIEKTAQPADVMLFEQGDVSVLTVGTEPFYKHFVGQSGRERVVVTAKDGDTWKKIASRYGVTVRELERINNKERSSALKVGQKVIVYVKRAPSPAPAPASEAPKEAPKEAVVEEKASEEDKGEAAAAPEGPPAVVDDD
jgi:membrane-bound lytic murein transglycosylase D